MQANTFHFLRPRYRYFMHACMNLLSRHSIPLFCMDFKNRTLFDLLCFPKLTFVVRVLSRSRIFISLGIFVHVESAVWKM